MTLDQPVEPGTIGGPHQGYTSPPPMDICMKCLQKTETPIDHVRSPRGLDGITVGGYRSYCACSCCYCLCHRDPQPHPWRPPPAQASPWNPHHAPRARPAVPARVQWQESCAKSSALVFRHFRTHRIFHSLSPFPTCKYRYHHNKVAVSKEVGRVK